MADNPQHIGTSALSGVVRDSLESLSSGERKVGRALLANYPIAGLETVAELARLAAISDARRGDVLVVFDYRRYDARIVQLAEQAAGRGAEVVLFTDRWLSPAADVATTVLPADVAAPSPFDSLVPALALVEAVIAGVTDRLGEAGRQRLEAIEAMRGHSTAAAPSA